jgi:hypothetical protein
MTNSVPNMTNAPDHRRTIAIVAYDGVQMSAVLGL